MSALFLLAAAPAVADAQETVRSARLVADLTAPDGTATVRVEFRVAGVEPGSALGATILDFGRARAVDLRTDEGRRLITEAGAGVSRGVMLPTGPADAEGVVRIVVEYDVAEAVVVKGRTLRGHVPVITVDRPPGEPGPDVFLAELYVPEEWSIREGFPSGLSAAGEPGVYDVGLSVVPSAVSFRGRSDGAWRPGLSLALEVLAGAVLLGFSLAGWRHLRGAGA